MKHAVESSYAWWRLFVSLVLMTMGGAGMYAISVVLPAVQKDFNVARADASLPYTLTMIGFGIGGILMGRLADKRGTAWVIVLGGLGLCAGFSLAAWAPTMLVFNVAQGLLLGLLGSAATMGPLVADTTQWFNKRRGIALAVCMSGNYVAGALWPPVIEYFMRSHGWRATYVGVGLACMLVMLPLAWVYRVRPPGLAAAAAVARPGQGSERPLGLAPAVLQNLLIVAGVSCCVAMAMPQVHIVAYCSDLGIGVTRGAQMLSVMLGMGIISRLVSGWISDHIGGLRTLLLGSVLQGVALLMFYFADQPTSLFIVSALFGLFQGGIVPSYALIVREHFTPQEAGARVGTVLMATLLGMALGGWMSGAIFDATGSYRAAFLNGIAWNLLNVSIAGFLLTRLVKQEKGAKAGQTGRAYSA